MSTLTITIERKNDDHWPVVVEWARAGEIGKITRNGRLVLDLRTLRIRVTARAYGADLGKALFAGAIRDTFLEARATGVVHVRLEVRAADLTALHWERLCAPGDNDDWNFLRLDQRTPFAYLLPRVSDRQFRSLNPGDLRALIVVARPDDLLANGLDEFDAEATVAGLRRALSGIPHDVLGPVAGAAGPATLDALCDQLTAQRYTLLHIVCHGHYESETGDTFLYIASPQNTTVAVSGNDLLARLAPLGALPHAVFLATCESARPTAGDAMLGLAQRLVRESRLGVPFVVAMTERVSIATADALAARYYERLRARGEPDSALTEACAGLQGRYDVIVPMLFTGADGSVLFSEEPALPASGPAQSLHQLPSDPPHFTGRDADVDAICALVRAGTGAATTVIHGAGGVGKTALAIVVANRVRADFPDAQIVLDLRGTSADPAAPADLLAQVIRAFRGADVRLPAALADLVGMVHSCLADKRALLLADNARDADQVQPLVPSAGSALLITTRNRFYINGMQTRDLNILDPESAQSLLLAYNAAIAADASDIAATCGGLPLALTLAARWTIENPMFGAREWLRRAADVAARLRLTGADTALAVSLAMLPDAAQQAWCALAVFPAEFHADGALAVWDLADDEARTRGMDALAALWRYSLVDYDAASNRYRLHDLARAFAGSRLSDAEREAAAVRHARHFADLLAAIQQRYAKGGDAVTQALALYDQEVANIAAGQAWAAAHAGLDDSAAAICDDYARRTGEVLDLRLTTRQWIGWLESALAVARRLKLRDHEGAHINNLGGAYYTLGEVRRAIDYYEQGLAIARETGSRSSEGMTLGNLGNAYADLGNLRAAIDYYEQALAIARDTANRSSEGAQLVNLGIAYRELGDARRAIEYYREALEIDRSLGNRHGEGMALGNLAVAHAALGETQIALAYYDQALVIARALGDRHNESRWSGGLGLAHAALGDFERAIGYYNDALAVARETGDRRGEGIDLGNLGNAYTDLGDPRRAIECHAQALAIAREIGNRNGEGLALANLGSAYAALGDSERAFDDFTQALTIMRALGDKHSENSILELLGDICARTNAVERAADWYDQQLRLVRETGERHRESIALAKLGIMQARLGDLRAAMDCQSQALALCRELGDRTGEGGALANLAGISDATGDRATAIDYLHQALAAVGTVESPFAAQIRAQLQAWEAVPAQDPQRAANLPGSTADELFGRATTLDFLGDREGAVALMRQAADAYRAAGIPADRARDKLREWGGEADGQ